MLAWGNSLITVESCQFSTCAARSKPSPLMMHLELAREQQFHFMITLKVAESIFFLYGNENKTFQAFCQNVFEWKNTFLDQKDQISLCSLSFSFPLILETSPPPSQHGHFSIKPVSFSRAVWFGEKLQQKYFPATAMGPLHAKIQQAESGE